jgi:hypothetical protein
MDERNTGNNKVVLDLIDHRLQQGNEKFGREIPIDGTYDLVEALEEALDLAIYLSSKIVELRNKRWGVKRERSTINHRPKVMVEAIEKETMSRMGQAGCRGGDCD